MNDFNYFLAQIGKLAYEQKTTFTSRRNTGRIIFATSVFRPHHGKIGTVVLTVKYLRGRMLWQRMAMLFALSVIINAYLVW